MRRRRLGHCALFVLLILASCDSGSGLPSPTPTKLRPDLADGLRTSTSVPPTTPTSVIGDPCPELRSVHEQTPIEFSLDESHAWRMCFVGAAAGTLQTYLFFSRDGGGTWSLISVATSPGPIPGVGWLPNLGGATALVFSSPDNGWLGLDGQDDQKFWRSRDGGRTWEPVSVGEPDALVKFVEFDDVRHGRVSFNDGRDFTTNDGGENWFDFCTPEHLPEGGEPHVGPAFTLDDTHRWQVCLGKAGGLHQGKSLIFSANDGSTWKIMSIVFWGPPTPVPGAGLLPGAGSVTVLLFLDESHGWLGTNGPAFNLWRTNDGGVTWTDLRIMRDERVKSIEFDDPRHGRVAGSRTQWITEDGGDTWIQVLATPTPTAR